MRDAQTCRVVAPRMDVCPPNRIHGLAWLEGNYAQASRNVTVVGVQAASVT